MNHTQQEQFEILKAPPMQYLMDLRKQPVRFDTVIEKEDMLQQVESWLCR